MPRPLLPPPTDEERAVLARAKARLDRLHLYPTPVDASAVRILHVPWFFRIPGMRRYHGYEAGPYILLRRPIPDAFEDLVVHELCHVWQSQHRAVRMWLSYLWEGYRNNRHEVEARYAAVATREPAA